jgi:hypothetical protein
MLRIRRCVSSAVKMEAIFSSESLVKFQRNIMSHVTRASSPTGHIIIITVILNVIIIIIIIILFSLICYAGFTVAVTNAINKKESKSHYDRQSVGQSVLVSGTHLGPATNLHFLSLTIFRQLWVCWCGAPSLTRSRVCSFQFLPGITSAAFHRSESHGTHQHILLFSFFISSNVEGQVTTVFISPRNRVVRGTLIKCLLLLLLLLLLLSL